MKKSKYRKENNDMTGKSKCKILKDIRREIAKQNDIDLVIDECKFKGDCLGTCPKCEAEVRYLEKELEKRRSLGKTVAIAGLVTALAIPLSSCDLLDRVKTPVQGEMPAIESTADINDLRTAGIPPAPPKTENTGDSTEDEILQGKFGIESESGEDGEFTDIPGEVAATSGEPEKVELLGDVAFPYITTEEEGEQTPETTAPSDN